jgi:hypothetical protein
VETGAYEIALLGPRIKSEDEPASGVGLIEASYVGYARVRVAAEDCGHDGDLIQLPEIDFPRVEGEAGPRTATAFSLRRGDGRVFRGTFWGVIPLRRNHMPRISHAQVNTKGDGA